MRSEGELSAPVQRLHPARDFLHIFGRVGGDDRRWECNQAVQTSHTDLIVNEMNKLNVAYAIVLIPDLELLNSIDHLCSFIDTHMILALRCVAHDGPNGGSFFPSRSTSSNSSLITEYIDKRQLVFQNGEGALPVPTAPSQTRSSKTQKHSDTETGNGGLSETNSGVLKST